jgi:hypothetical protein
MNANAVVNRYHQLTPEERFRLILAAGGRGDEAERDRLVRTGERVRVLVSDHAPYARAFEELALLVLIELLDELAGYLNALLLVESAADNCGAVDQHDSEAAGQTTEEEPDAQADAEPADDDDRDRPFWRRALDSALASGYMLKTKADGWKLFCERMNVPPFLVWKELPGFDRLQHALAVIHKTAFAPEDFLRWLNRVRPAGEPECTKLPLTVEAVADSTEEVYRKQVEWRGG